jgi:hypothetical protein
MSWKALKQCHPNHILTHFHLSLGTRLSVYSVLPITADFAHIFNFWLQPLQRAHDAHKHCQVFRARWLSYFPKKPRGEIRRLNVNMEVSLLMNMKSGEMVYLVHLVYFVFLV